MQVERRVNLFTMPRRRRFKPRIDCVAILGKLSERVGSLGSLGEIGNLEKIGSLGAIGYNKYKYRYLFC